MKAKRRQTNAAENPPTVPAAIDLQPFCLADDLHPGLAQPWSHRTHTYATDGKVIIRVPRRPECPEAALTPAQSAAALFDANPLPPAKSLTALPPLPRVKGWTVSCPLCHGSGATITAKGKPAVCERCEGEKRVLNTRPVAIGERQLATHYLLKLADLPGIRIAAQHGKAHEPLRFAFDGGEGLLMPLRLSPSTPNL